MRTFTVHCDNAVHYRAEITVEAEDIVSACRAACRCGPYGRWLEEPRYGIARLHRRDRRGSGHRSVASFPERCGCFRPPRPAPVLGCGDGRGLCSDTKRGSGRPAPHHDRCHRRRWQREDHPGRDGALVRDRESPSRRHRELRCQPHSKRSDKHGGCSARRHLTPDSLPPEGCGTWAAARPPQPQKSGPSCR